jgi:hypothetical protein
MIGFTSVLVNATKELSFAPPPLIAGGLVRVRVRVRVLK